MALRRRYCIIGETCRYAALTHTELTLYTYGHAENEEIIQIRKLIGKLWKNMISQKQLSIQVLCKTNEDDKK